MRIPNLSTGLALCAALALAACGATMLPNTEIPDTEETRAVHSRVMQYRQAMEDRDVDAILAMVSDRYYENAGTTDSDADDYGADELRSKVAVLLRDNVLAVQYRIILRDIQVDGDMAHADYEYYYRFKFVEGGREGWAQRNDFNRLEFVREGTSWKITGGL